VKFSVCIPTIRPGTLGAAIRSIIGQDFQDWELVVVGQGNEAVLREITERAAGSDKRVSYIHLDRRGASAARNAGLEASGGEFVAFMDDDCEADTTWLSELDRSFEADIGFVSGPLVAPQPQGKHLFALCPTVEVSACTYDRQSDGERTPTGFGLLGANMAVRRVDADRAGRFDENMGAGAYFTGGEEHDYAHRLMRAGVRMRSSPGAVVRHTSGYRYGFRTVYSYKVARFRGDGAAAAKGLLRSSPEGTVPIRGAVVDFVKLQLGTVRVSRLFSNAFRIYHMVNSYRDCLRNFQLLIRHNADPVTAVLVRRGDSRRSVTGPTVFSSANRPEVQQVLDTFGRVVEPAEGFPLSGARDGGAPEACERAPHSPCSLGVHGRTTLEDFDYGLQHSRKGDATKYGPPAASVSGPGPTSSDLRLPSSGHGGRSESSAPWMGGSDL
jgi:glycosyltransferase involved in cell wall biosynthesis